MATTTATASDNIIQEYVLQPRTGSQCPMLKGSKGEDGGSICQGKGDKQFSWDKNHIQSLTFGYYKRVPDDDLSQCMTYPGEPFWAFGKVADTDNDVVCIKPVEELCSLKKNTWDGYNYVPETWTSDEVSDRLRETVSNVQFAKTCNQYDDGGIAYNVETPMSAQQCPVECSYDTSMFTTLQHVEDYELKYGMFDRDDRSGCKTSIAGQYANYEDARACLSKTTGKMLKGDATNMYSDNYNKIMTQFCSQKSNECGVDPLSVGSSTNESERNKKRDICSFLNSATPSGEKCRAWLNSFGPYKYSIMDDIGNLYCTKHPSSDECMCYGAVNGIVGTPNYDSYQTVVEGMAEAGLIVNPACFYKPCADPSNYIVGTDVFVPLGAGEKSDPTYGFTCVDNLCASITNTGDAVTQEMSGNKVYIQCGEGLEPGKSGGDGFFAENIANNKYILATFIVACVIGGLLLLVVLYKLFASSSSDNNNNKFGGGTTNIGASFSSRNYYSPRNATPPNVAVSNS